MGFCCLSAAWLKAEPDHCSQEPKTEGPGDGTGTGTGTERTLPSVGSQLERILQPVQKLVGELTDVLEQRKRKEGGNEGEREDPPDGELGVYYWAWREFQDLRRSNKSGTQC